jgi:hypothetical protein
MIKFKEISIGKLDYILTIFEKYRKSLNVHPGINNLPIQRQLVVLSILSL